MALLAMASGTAMAQATQNPPASDAAKPSADTTKVATGIAPDKEALIRKFFQVQGTDKLMRETMVSMSTSIRPLLVSSLPAGEYRDKLIDLFFQKFQSKMDVNQLIGKLIPIYDKYFTSDELEQLIRFYQTPIGQKFLSVLPQTIADTQDIARKWGEGLGRDSMVEVLEEHPEMKKALEDAAAQQKN
jgi:hypothetical protein